jgi:hypothetical protein
MSLSYPQQVIYNTHLKSSRANKGKPWRPRKDFSNFDEVDKKKICKIENILTTKNIDIEDYFNAPYKLWNDESSYELKFFSSFKGIKAYYLWYTKLMFTDPDNTVIVNAVKVGWKNIFDKCKKHKFTSIDDYFNLKSYYPEFLVDLSERKITYFNILAARDYSKIIKRIPKEEVDFIENDFYNTIETLRARYYQSKLKTLNINIKNKLNKILR